MILRRVIAHFRKQEWTAIAIDFVIVVVGVFIGIQVANWNEARRDRASEETYLAGLAKDLRGDIAEIDEIVRISTVRIAAMNYLIEKATGGKLPKGFNSARGVIEVQPAPPFNESDSGSAGVALFILTTLEGNRLAYETMINTGGIGLIRDASLLRDIQGYYAKAADARDFEVGLKDSRVRLVDAQQAAGISPVDETPAAALATAFGADARLLAAAKNYWLYTNRHIKLMRDLRSKAEALLDRIGNDGSE
ncbi:MAG: DUF6090 family protein [Pseudomonadota bacterium]